MRILNVNALLPGYVVHRRSYGVWYDTGIRDFLGSWGNHDAPVLAVPGYPGGKALLDCEPPQSHLTTIDSYNMDIMAGACECRVYAPVYLFSASGQPVAWNTQMGVRAATWAAGHLVGVPYDYSVYVHMILYRFFGATAAALIHNPQKARWCTESLSDEYARSPVDLRLTLEQWITPLTMERLVEAVLWRDASDECMVDYEAETGGRWAFAMGG